MNPMTPTAAERWKGVLERTAWTYVQFFLGALLLSSQDTIFSLSTVQSAALAGIPAAVTFLTANMPVLGEGSGPLDVAVRAARTFAVSFLGFIGGMQVFHYDAAAWKMAAASAAIAALAGIKSAIATQFGNPDTGATLSVAADPVPLAA